MASEDDYKRYVDAMRQAQILPSWHPIPSQSPPWPPLSPMPSLPPHPPVYGQGYHTNPVRVRPSMTTVIPYFNITTRMCARMRVRMRFMHGINPGDFE